MGTKIAPSDFDCYAKLYNDEPYFVLRAKDPIGSMLVHLWVSIRRAIGGTDNIKLSEASAIADDMHHWRIKHFARPAPKPAD